MSLLDTLNEQLQGEGVVEISKSLGLDQRQVGQVVNGALPALLGGLARNSAAPGGADSLAAALDRDHDGSVLDDLAGFLGQGGVSADGVGILRHVFGARQQNIEGALSGASGLDASSVSRILTMLAPLVMGALGKTQRQEGLDASGLSRLLGQEQRAAQQAAPEAMDMLGRLLDMDGDGNALDDVARLGSNLLGSLFGGKK